MVPSPENLCFKSEREDAKSMDDHRKFISGVVEGAIKNGFTLSKLVHSCHNHLCRKTARLLTQHLK